MRVLVTGAASGIGAATCELLAAEGHEPVAADLATDGDVIGLNVADEHSWVRVFDRIGRIDGLVNCAGIRTRSVIADTELVEFERHLRVNVTGSWLGIREMFRRHRPGLSAAVVNVASVNAQIAVAGQAHYAASKGAVVAPGPIRTRMTEERLVDPQQVAWLEGRVPLGRVGEPAEVAGVIGFLLSEVASYVTGAVLYADGGWVANGA